MDMASGSLGSSLTGTRSQAWVARGGQGPPLLSFPLSQWRLPTPYHEWLSQPAGSAGRLIPNSRHMQCSKQRAYWGAFPTSTIRGKRIVKVEPRPGSLSTVMSPPII
jgi:hypothetical protein